jgi:hypothetical protein
MTQPRVRSLATGWSGHSLFYEHERVVSSRLIEVVCAAVLCITLSLGLWPFHAPGNEVSWLQDRNGLHFGRHATVFSSGEFRMTAAQSLPSGSLEIWLQPGRIWNFSTFLTFYIPGIPLQFSLRQAQTGLSLQAAGPDDPNHAHMRDLNVENVFRKTGPTFITVTSGTEGTTVYVDGLVAKQEPQFRVSRKAFSGRLILGDSAEQGDSWAGQLLGVAIYNRALTAAQVLEHYQAWTQMGKLQTPQD